MGLLLLRGRCGGGRSRAGRGGRRAFGRGAGFGGSRCCCSHSTAGVTGPVEDLALWAWTRGGSVSISGVPQAVAALDALIAQGMQ